MANKDMYIKIVYNDVIQRYWWELRSIYTQDVYAISKTKFQERIAVFIQANNVAKVLSIECDFTDV